MSAVSRDTYRLIIFYTSGFLIVKILLNYALVTFYSQMIPTRDDILGRSLIFRPSFDPNLKF